MSKVFQPYLDGVDWLKRPRPFFTLRRDSYILFLQLRSRGLIHWLIAGLLIAAGIIAEHVLDRRMAFEGVRFKTYSFLQSSGAHQARSKRTVLVLIADDEYFGVLGRRVPIKRDYLARLIRALDRADPELIALDFDLRSPMPHQGSSEHQDYVEETKELAAAVAEVSVKRKIVLPVTLRSIKEKGHEEYLREPTVLDEYHLISANVEEGYISLPYDRRQLPLVQTTKNSGPIKSFAAAATNLIDNASLTDALERSGDSLPFGTFIESDHFSAVSSADVLLADPDRTMRSKLGCKIVIVGGGWSENSYASEERGDEVSTPSGPISGTFLHANYIEALLDSRTFKPLKGTLKVGLALLLSVVVAVILGLRLNAFLKLLIVVMVLGGATFLLTYLLWHNLGVFFDFCIPVGLLVVHWGVERVLGK